MLGQGQCWEGLLPSLLKPAQPLLGPELLSDPAVVGVGVNLLLGLLGMLMDPFSLISEEL